jgi:hypothetical protein
MANVACLSGKPLGARTITYGCKCDWCESRAKKFPVRELELDDLLGVAKRHNKCQGNILGAMLSYRRLSTEKVVARLKEGGFTDADIRAGMEALSEAIRCFEKMKALGYKWEPIQKIPIVVK